MGGRNRFQRPSISAPVGPMKSSRGADLQRSQKLIIVDTIKDCEATNPTSIQEKINREGIQAATVSARLVAHGPLVGSPTANCVEATAAPNMETSRIPKSGKRTRRSLLPASSSILRPPFKTVSTTALLSNPKFVQQDENVPPAPIGDYNCPTPAASLPKTKLPKSRTMNALHEIRTSISRSSLAVRSINSSNITTSSPKTPSSSITSPAFPSNASKLRLPRTSLTSVTKSSRSCSPEPQPYQISDAQSSAYWSGRFVALHDRYSSESLSEASQPSSGSQGSLSQLKRDIGNPYTKFYQRAAHLPHSTTTSALKTLTSTSMTASVNEDDARCNRVFQHLDSLCITSEARRSLHTWQQAYARRHNRPSLLPEGGFMEDRGFMAKIFNAASRRKGERRSFGALREASAHRNTKSKAVLSGNLPGATKGKRLTLS